MNRKSCLMNGGIFRQQHVEVECISPMHLFLDFMIKVTPGAVIEGDAKKQFKMKFIVVWSDNSQNTLKLGTRT